MKDHNQGQLGSLPGSWGKNLKNLRHFLWFNPSSFVLWKPFLPVANHCRFKFDWVSLWARGTFSTFLSPTPWRLSPLCMRTNVVSILNFPSSFRTKMKELHDLICTTPRLCQKNMTPVALRGRGTTSTYNCFPATGLYFKSKVLASVGRGSTETTRLQHGSSMFGDTHARGGGGTICWKLLL